MPWSKMWLKFDLDLVFSSTLVRFVAIAGSTPSRNTFVTFSFKSFLDWFCTEAFGFCWYLNRIFHYGFSHFMSNVKNNVFCSKNFFFKTGNAALKFFCKSERLDVVGPSIFSRLSGNPKSLFGSEKVCGRQNTMHCPN